MAAPTSSCSHSAHPKMSILIPPVRPRDDSQNDQRNRTCRAEGSPIIDVQESHGEEAGAKGEAEDRGLQKLATTQHHGAAPAHQRVELVPLVVLYVPQTFVRTSNPFASKAGLLPNKKDLDGHCHLPAPRRLVDLAN